MRVRLLPWSVADGPTNMALDEALLDAAAEGIASLRFYGWAEPTLSLGYFQPSAPARAYPGLGELPWLRRHSGGAALVHHHELTYALALPAGSEWQPRGVSWIARMHGYVQSALAVEAVLCEREEKLGEVLCFLHHTPGDLILAGHKVAGSAQRKRRGALLQHGGVLLAQSAHTPQLPGVAELTGRGTPIGEVRTRLLEVVRSEAGWLVEPGGWSVAETASVPGRVAALRVAGLEREALSRPALRVDTPAALGYQMETCLLAGGPPTPAGTEAPRTSKGLDLLGPAV